MDISDGFVYELAKKSFVSSGYEYDDGYTSGFCSGFMKALEFIEQGVITEYNTGVMKSYDNSDNA